MCVWGGGAGTLCVVVVCSLSVQCNILLGELVFYRLYCRGLSRIPPVTSTAVDILVCVPGTQVLARLLSRIPLRSRMVERLRPRCPEAEVSIATQVVYGKLILWRKL